jgi:hypothetical protein
LADDIEMRRRLQKALDLAGNTHEIDDVVAGVRSGALQAFSSENAFVVTEIAVAPRKKWLNVFLAVGQLDEVMELQPQVEAFGREQGCEFMVMTGRKGWLKVLPEYGWRENGVSYARPLQENAHG